MPNLPLDQLISYSDACKKSLEDLPRMIPVEECSDLSPQDLNFQMLIRKKLMGRMVGSLYPSIVWGEILKLRELYYDKTKAFNYWG